MGAQKKEADDPHSLETSKDGKDDVTYDQLISTAGEFGTYQLLLFFSTFPFYIFGVFSYFSQQFMTEVAPQHWCWIPELENLTTIQRRDLAIPKDEHDAQYGYSRCFNYDANWTEILASGVRPDETWKTVPCQNGWEFNKTEFPYATIASDLGWVCEKDSYQASAQSLFFVGSIIGGFFIGWIADRFGRLPAAVASNVIGACAGAGSICANNFIQFAICRIIMGMSYDNCMIMSYLIVLEYTSPKYRTLITNMSFAVFYTGAAVALPWISLACGDWRTIGLVTSLSMLLSVLAPLVIPESARWLLSKDRSDEAIKKVLKIAKINKKEIPSEMIEKFKLSIANNTEEQASFLSLVKSTLLRKIFICTCVVYMCCMIIFDALIRSIGQLQFDFFVTFSLISLTELPSLVIISFALDYTGRKLMLLSAMSTSAVFSFLIPFVGVGIPSVVCAVVARFAINMCVNTAMQWSAEMLPTSVRGSGTSVIHICGYVATVISPFVAYLDTYVAALPMLVIGAVGVLGVFVALFLPETAGKEMPQTIEDAENLIRKQVFLEVPCLKKKKTGSRQ